MNNTETIERIKEETSDILEKLATTDNIIFEFNELNFNDKIHLNGIPLVGSAVATVLAHLQVRNKFIDFSHLMTSEDWQLVSEKLKAINSGTVMYAKTVPNDNGHSEIVELFPRNSNKKKPDDLFYVEYINWILEALQQTDYNYSLKAINFDSKANNLTITLLDEDRKIDVCGNNLDVWKMGNRFSFDGFKFDYAPFFERLICSNGNTATKYGFGANINQAKFNNTKIKNTINASLLQDRNSLPEIITQAVKHSQKNNVSVQEFYNARRFFDTRNNNGIYSAILERYFSIQPLYDAYGENVENRSYMWKATADTGINAYDLFNAMTYIASHPDKIQLNQRHQLDLQIEASNLLLKEEFDLEKIAPKIKVAYPRLEIMN